MKNIKTTVSKISEQSICFALALMLAGLCSYDAFASTKTESPPTFEMRRYLPKHPYFGKVCKKFERCLKRASKTHRLHLTASQLTDATVPLIQAVKGTVHELKFVPVYENTLRLIGQLTDLTKLDLTGTEVTDARLKDLEPLTQIEELSLVGTNVSDGGVAELKSLKNLKELYLFKTKVTDAGVEELQESLPKLKVSYRKH